VLKSAPHMQTAWRMVKHVAGISDDVDLKEHLFMQ
jgi:hypothetical protein